MNENIQKIALFFLLLIFSTPSEILSRNNLVESKTDGKVHKSKVDSSITTVVFSNRVSLNKPFVGSMGSSTFQSFNGILYSLEQKPQFNSIPPDKAWEDSLYKYYIESSDANGDSLSHTIIEAPESMEIISPAVLIWTPEQADTGAHSITIAVFDAKKGDITFQSWELYVYSVNDPSTILFPDTLVSFLEDDSVEVQFSSFIGDVDNTIDELTLFAEVIELVPSNKSENPTKANKKENDLAYSGKNSIRALAERTSVESLDDEVANDNLQADSATSNLQITINQNTKTVDFHITPDSNGHFMVIFGVQDLEPLTVYDTTIVTVIPVNDAPVVEGIPNVVFEEDSTFSFDLDQFVYDVDNDTSEITWTVAMVKDSIVGRGGAQSGFRNEPELIKGKHKRNDRESSENLNNGDITNTFKEVKNNVLQFSMRKSSIENNLSTRNPLKNVAVGYRVRERIFDIGSRSEGTILLLIAENGEVLDSLTVSIDPVSHEVLFEAPPNYYAFDIKMEFTATDPEGVSDKDSILVFVSPVNDPPVVVNFPDTITIEFGKSDTLILSKFVTDIDDLKSMLNWEEQICTGAGSYLCISVEQNILTMTPMDNYNGIEIAEFIVSDTSGATDTAFTVIRVLGPQGNDRLIPEEFVLFQNFPNPFNPNTTIRYGIPNGGSDVSLIIFNLMGQEVIRWDEENLQPGYYERGWSGTNKYGVPVGSGVYFYRIIAGKFTTVQKMVLLK